MNRRYGFTLLEMIAIMGISAVLTGIAVFTLHALLKSHNAGREHLEYRRTLNRLAEQFRRDVHATQETSVDDKAGILELLPIAPNTIEIRYQCLPDRLERKLFQGEKIISRESYMLPEDLESSLQLQSQSDVTIAIILISPKARTPKPFYTAPARIEALLGLDRRLAKVQAATKKEETETAAAEQPTIEKAAREQPATEDKP